MQAFIREPALADHNVYLYQSLEIISHSSPLLVTRNLTTGASSMDDDDDALFEDGIDDIMLASVTESINVQPQPPPKVIIYIFTIVDKF